MTTPRIARAELTAVTLAKLYWQRHAELITLPRQAAHVVTLLGFEADQGAITITECRADRGDSDRFCALLHECNHSTTDHDFEAFGDGDTMLCPNGGMHIMMSDADSNPGWYYDTRKCRFFDYCDMDEALDDLEIKRRGVYLIRIAEEDWQAGAVTLEVVATIGEPVSGYAANTVRAETDRPLRFGTESDIRDIVCAKLDEPEVVQFSPEDSAIVIQVDSLVDALTDYADGRPVGYRPRALSWEPSRRRPVATMDTGGLT